MGFSRICRSPHFFEKLPAADQLAAVAGQHFQHAPLGRREMHFGTVFDDLLAGQIDGE